VRHLLAVDLGLRTGLAVFSEDGQLRRYGSHNLGSRARLRRAADSIVRSAAGLVWLVAEGDRNLYRIWQRPAMRAGAQTVLVPPEVWRETLIRQRDRSHARLAKAAARRLAERVIRRSEATKAKTLQHDAAEAILIGFYWARTLGWVSSDSLCA
jgi:hypothetical protein